MRTPGALSYLQPSEVLPPCSCPWSHISLDFITGLPPSHGHTVILTVVDWFSKMVHFVPLPKLPSAKETTELMLTHVFHLHGLPVDVVSDWGAHAPTGFQPPLFPDLEEEVSCPSVQAFICRCRRTWTQARAALLRSSDRLKAVLSAPPSSGALDLSGIPLAARDMERLCAHLQRHASTVVSLELGFTELTDEAFLLLLPTLAALPNLETLALNGNRLTRAILKELTDALKDPGSFPSVTWIDLGNNVDIFSLPQPFLVSLRKRCPKQGNLPTILEFGESQASDPPERLRGLGEEEETDDTNRTESMGELRSEVEEELDGEMEIEEMMEELLDFDREVQGKEDEEESMWTVGEQRKVGRARARRGEEVGEKEEERKEQRLGRRAAVVEDEDDTQSHSSRLSCSSQSQHSSVAVEPMRAEKDDLDEFLKLVVIGRWIGAGFLSLKRLA
ncbi:hypothetical protein L3Q82_005048 [Scortum barcoo]|uniref:Uncharacterized protein n=1 Tax=Scortum barcoo TaxID=214431 RepID=A0ACB8VF11_9TELE|nr:hypothetical protein L3Q82_005048 [Scortum barcoo]